MKKNILTFSIFLLLCSNISVAGILAPGKGGHYLYNDDTADKLQSYNEINNQNELDQIDDPFETINRLIFSSNIVLDDVFVQPMVNFYKYLVPLYVQDRVSDFVSNAYTPVILINDLLQGNMSNASDSFGRFLINTTIGFIGTIDIASEIDIEYHREDFGQTMSTYNVPSGPYLVLPLLGPSSFKDSLGKYVDYRLNPIQSILDDKTVDAVNYIGIVNSRTDKYDLMNNIRQNSIDPYETIKSLYWQNRRHSINEFDEGK